ncbi:lysine biosynthesis protein LysW (plasmid) [Staphylococcus epidermidis]|uniref:alpha-aminoadipate/glutamate carrier protein LysW n=1 Tax=Staphylococcus epidermidis TaxID=1282 RepID=UPI00031C8D5D|nr:alpha-aminoadipate/glutamate carrier protein LysW [Staphylococcus epidermidis]QGY86808.1 lysine biosynthesis protein LysW [Staphylococcus epidermidis]
MELECLTCGSVIKLENDLMEGEIVECDSCGQEHELVKSGDSYKLDFAPEIEEDWGE